MLLVLLAGISGAQELTVDYLEGSLISRVDGNSVKAAVGDVVSPEAELELSRGGFVELGYRGATVALVEGGSYTAAVLMEAAEDRGDFRDFLSGLSFLRKGRRPATAVAGTRASGHPGRLWFMTDAQAAEADSQMMFIDTDYLRNGLELMDVGDYPGAAWEFFQGMDREYDEETRRECAFRLGLASQMAGEIQYARDVLLSPSTVPDPHFGYYGEYVLTASALHIEAREYEDARELLEAYLAAGPAGGMADAALYLLELAR